MTQPRDDLAAVGADSLYLPRGARICLGATGAGLLAIGTVGLLAFKLDGAGITTFVISGAILGALGVMGRLPTRLKLKDVEVGWQLQLEEKNAIALTASKPDADDASLIEKAAKAESTTDLTIPLFEDSARLADLAAISPKAAFLAIYGELEEQIRGLVLDAGLLPEARRLGQLRQVVESLVDHNWLNGWYVSVFRALSNARNAVAHSPSDVPDFEVSALLELAVEFASDVKVRRQAAIAGYTPKAGPGPVKV